MGIQLYSYNVSICIIVKEDDIIGKFKFAFTLSLSFLLTISLDFKQREKYEDMIAHRSYAHNLNNCEIKTWKKCRGKGKVKYRIFYNAKCPLNKHQPGQVTQAIFPSACHAITLQCKLKALFLVSPPVLLVATNCSKLNLCLLYFVHLVALTCNTGDNICNNAFQLAPHIACKNAAHINWPLGNALINLVMAVRCFISLLFFKLNFRSSVLQQPNVFDIFIHA